MAAGKQYELLFQLTAKLGPNFQKSFNGATKVISTLQDDLKSADKKLQDVSAYTKQQNAVKASKQRVSELQTEHDRLTGAVAESAKVTAELTKKLQENEKAFQQAQEESADDAKQLSKLQAEHQRLVKEIGLSEKATSNLTKELKTNESTLQKEKNKASEAEETLEKLSDTLKKAGVNTDSLSKDTRELQKQYDKLAESQKKVQEITEKQGKNSGEISKTKSQLTGLIGTATALAGSFFALDSATEEYRVNQAKLSTAFQAAGFTTNTAKEAYAQFYAILGDNDTATEASQLLAQLTKSEEDVSKWTGIAAGVFGTFGDSLPIEALIESSNETARTGKITGNLADAINWAAKEGETFGVTLKANTKKNKEWNDAVKKAETAEDYFNLALQACTTEAERNQLIMDTLQGTYQSATDAFYENNKQIIKSRQSQIVYNDILAQVGRIAGTVKSSLLEMLGVTEDGSVKANSALSKVQDVLTKLADNPELIKTITKVVALLVGMKAGGLVAKLGFLNVKGGILSVQKAFATMKGLGVTKYLKNLTGGFGGIAKKIFPLIGIVAAVGGAIYYVSTHLEEVRGFIKKTFGEEGLAIFDKIWGVITKIGKALKEAFLQKGSGIMDAIMDIMPVVISTLQQGLLPLLPMITDMIKQIVPAAAELITQILPLLLSLINSIVPILVSLVSQILPVIVTLIKAVVPLILQIVQTILPALIQLIGAIVPIILQLVQSVLPAIIQLIQSLLPVIMQIIQNVLPVVISLLNTLIPIFMQIIQAILPPLQALLQALIPVILFVAQVFANQFGTALQSVAAVVQSIIRVFQGLIDFITGVFTGNWSQAWQGIKDIFGGIFSGIGETFKMPFRVIVSTINTVIRGLNKLTVPDWVPGIGGKGINIPEIPGFARGTNRTPNTFIAGENGPELITNAANRKVFTAAQTGKIFNNMAQAQNLNSPNGVNARVSGTGAITIQVTNNPQVIVQGGDTSNIKAQLEQYDDAFLEKIRVIIVSILREQKEQEGRVAYA